MHCSKCITSAARRSYCGSLFFSGRSILSTVVFYTDESGSTEAFTEPLQTGSTPIFTITSIALPLTEWRQFDRKYNNLKEHFFPEILARKGRKEDIEIKGNDLTSPRNKESERRQNFLKQVFALLYKFDAKIFSVTFVKSKDNPISSRSMYTHGFQILLERFNDYIKTSEKFDSGIIICDSRAGTMKGQGLDKEVAQSYQSYIFGNEKGKKCTYMQEAPLFADSKITVGLQLADIISSVIYTNHYNYYSSTIEGAVDYSHMQKWWPKVISLEYKKCKDKLKVVLTDISKLKEENEKLSKNSKSEQDRLISSSDQTSFLSEVEKLKKENEILKRDLTRFVQSSSKLKMLLRH